VLRDREFQRILFVKPSSLGDIVHALPTFAALRARFPKAQITWLVKHEWASLVERVVDLDRVWPLDPGVTGWLGQVAGLRREGFDLAVELQGLFRSGAMVWLAGCPVRLGFANAREGSPIFYTERIAVPTDEMHAVDRYLLVAEALGAARPASPQFNLQDRDADRESVSALLRRHGLSAERPWIAFNVAARWPTKRWPLASYAVVADRLMAEGLGPIALIGGPADRNGALEMAGLMRQKPTVLSGETAPGLLPALLRTAAVLVTNDSGPMHVAAAVGTPVVALFGPTSPVRTGPYGENHQVLQKRVPCSPCFSRACSNPDRLACLTGVAPDQVVEAVRQVFERKVEAKGELRMGKTLSVPSQP
jgi:lipopolysaccharide heptosyltransferase II